jgi:hypothetical protein
MRVPPPPDSDLYRPGSYTYTPACVTSRNTAESGVHCLSVLSKHLTIYMYIYSQITILDPQQRRRDQLTALYISILLFISTDCFFLIVYVSAECSLQYISWLLFTHLTAIFIIVMLPTSDDWSLFQHTAFISTGCSLYHLNNLYTIWLVSLSAICFSMSDDCSLHLLIAIFICRVFFLSSEYFLYQLTAIYISWPLSKSYKYTLHELTFFYISWLLYILAYCTIYHLYILYINWLLDIHISWLLSIPDKYSQYQLTAL